MLRPPFLSEFDPSEEAEGSIDPLGLQPVYERLADRLLPAITIRMGRPRFVTAMAVGACICEHFGADEVAADEITPPWLVWEWLLVQAFVEAEDALTAKSSIPGIQKVRRALRNQRPVSASAYLKTPGTFGFSGVYRRLARHIGILTEDGHLDDGGYELVNAWAKDQGLMGFIDASSGDGHAWRQQLRAAVLDGMARGHTTRQNQAFWRNLALRFDPAKPGRNEKAVLLSRILQRAGSEEIIAHLSESLVAHGRVIDREGEAPFFRKLSVRAAVDLKTLLTAIDVYEGFCRVITNSFDSLRHSASINGGAPVDAKAFSAAKAIKISLEALQPSIARIRTHPTLLEWETDQAGLVQTLERFEGVRNGTDLFDAVLIHHKKVQDNKPPNGKRTWFESALRGQVVRPGYTLENPPEQLGTYVHEYRVPSFSGFLADLGAFR